MHKKGLLVAALIFQLKAFFALAVVSREIAL